MLPDAMILAAGRATRLRPLTDRIAKAVVPFLNRPLLDFTLDWLRRHGFERVVINLHHAGSSIVDTYGDLAFGMGITYRREPVLLGTAGGPKAALEGLGSRALLINGDVITLLNLASLRGHHHDSGALATLALSSGPAARDYPPCSAAADGRLLGFPGDVSAEPAAVRGVFSGVHLIERAVLDSIPAGVVCGMVDAVYRPILAAGLPLHAIAVPGCWYEIGDAAHYIDNQLAALQCGDLPLALLRSRRMKPAGYLSAHTHLENVEPTPPFLLGAGVRVKHGCYLEGVVAGDRTRFEPGSRLRQVITWPGAWIGPGCDLRRVIVMNDVRVPAGTCAEGTVLTPNGPVCFEPSPEVGADTSPGVDGNPR